MRWQGRRGSGNIEDRRGVRGGGVAIGGGGLGLVALAVIWWALGGNPMDVLQGAGGVQQGGGEVTAEDEQAKEFVSVVLADTEEVWTQVFHDEVGRDYHPTVLVVFKGGTQSDCGGANAATGPFYCPVDKKVYLDTDFFTMMSQRLGANGDFARAYVVAHEVGHHVQDELGILGKTTEIRSRASEAESNAISVRVELQADCLAGVWAAHAEAMFGSLEPGDIAEAMNAAAADRRRHAAAQCRAAADAGQLHPRHLGAAPALVRARLPQPGDRQLRHLRRRRVVIPDGARPGSGSAGAVARPPPGPSGPVEGALPPRRGARASPPEYLEKGEAVSRSAFTLSQILAGGPGGGSPPAGSLARGARRKPRLAHGACQAAGWPLYGAHFTGWVRV